MELDCPYGAQEMRLGLLDCLESHAKFKKAKREGFKILEGLRAKNFEGKFGNEGFAEVFVKTVVIMVECESHLLRKDGAVYKQHLDLCKEATHWFSVLDANQRQKYHKPLVAYMCKCLHFLAGELDYFDQDLVCEFATATLTEYANS